MAPQEWQEHSNHQRLRNIDVAANTVWHITQVSCHAYFNEIVSHVNAAIKPAPVAEYVAPAPLVEHITPDPAVVHEYVAPAPVIEYVAPAPALLEPSVPVTHVMQVPYVQVIEKIVETPDILLGQGSQTSTSLGTAPVRQVELAEVPLPAESAPPMFLTTPVVQAAPPTVEHGHCEGSGLSQRATQMCPWISAGFMLAEKWMQDM